MTLFFKPIFSIMRVADFNFDLPDELIARYPKLERTASRLLQLNGENGEIFHRTFSVLLQIQLKLHRIVPSL